MRFLPRLPKASPVLAFVLGAALLAASAQAEAPPSGARFELR